MGRMVEEPHRGRQGGGIFALEGGLGGSLEDKFDEPLVRAWNQKHVYRGGPKHGVGCLDDANYLPKCVFVLFQPLDVLADIQDVEFMLRILLLKKPHILHRDAGHPLGAAVQYGDFHGQLLLP